MSAEFSFDPSEREFFSSLEREAPFVGARANVQHITEQFKDYGLQRFYMKEPAEATEIVKLLFDSMMTLHIHAGDVFRSKLGVTCFRDIANITDGIVKKALADDPEMIFKGITDAVFTEVTTSSSFTRLPPSIDTAYDRFRRYFEIAKEGGGNWGDSVEVNSLGGQLVYTLNRALDSGLDGKGTDDLALFIDQGNRNALGGYLEEAAFRSNKIKPLG